MPPAPSSSGDNFRRSHWAPPWGLTQECESRRSMVVLKLELVAVREVG